ncbi:MAG: hypothetical protein U5J99_11775 [Parvularculaceae bacterium]|nr:hypothetical protein [Parvularculaceae bacterium]
MILRRVIAHFRKQEWTAIAIDFVIVVVGVFVGIQVANWNEARQADEASRAVTARLIEDLGDEAWGFQYLLDYSDDVLTSAERALAALEGRIDSTDEALLIDAYRATQYREPRRRRSTYDELISTGEIGLIRDQTLRDLAIRVYSTPMFDNIRQEGVGSRYREAFRMTVPIPVQRALSGKCGDRTVIIGDYTSIIDQLDYPCTTGLSPEALREAAAVLEADAQIARLLRLRIADIETRRGDMLAPVNKDIREGLRAFVERQP